MSDESGSAMSSSRIQSASAMDSTKSTYSSMATQSRIKIFLAFFPLEAGKHAEILKNALQEENFFCLEGKDALIKECVLVIVLSSMSFGMSTHGAGSIEKIKTWKKPYFIIKLSRTSVFFADTYFNSAPVDWMRPLYVGEKAPPAIIASIVDMTHKLKFGVGKEIKFSVAPM